MITWKLPGYDQAVEDGAGDGKFPPEGNMEGANQNS